MTNIATGNRARQNRRILISGASVAGPSLAWWLARHGFRPTVVERAPQLRGGGYAVDFRGAAHLSVLAKMGILDRIRERQTHLSATTYVDADGRPVASMPAGIFAGDVEILRGDLGRILYEATRDSTEYLFGDSITGLYQDAGGVHVTFRRAAPQTFDLVMLLAGAGAVPFLVDGNVTSSQRWTEITRAFEGSFFAYAIWFN